MNRCAFSVRASVSAVAAFALLVLCSLPAAAQAPSATPTVSSASHVSTSIPLRDMAVLPHIYRNQGPFVVPNRFPYRFDSQPIPEMRPGLVDPVLDAPPLRQNFRAGQGTLLTDFEGTPVVNTAPPDPTGEVGPNHYVQMVNSRTTIYSRAGAILLGPVNNNTFWSGAGGLCEVNNDGDPIVLYDETADRWLISQFVSADGPDAMCVAISTTPDPTGAYHRYEFAWPEGFPDYPKFGVWPTGYALTTSLFPDAGGSFSQAVMLERDQMLLGNAAQSIRFTLNDGTVDEYYSMLPADFNGPAPPAGTPALFAGLRLSSGTAANREVLRLYTLTPDWATPANSTLTYVGGLPVAPFDVYALFSRSTAIPQLGTADRIAGLGHRPMMQLQYRNFGGTGRLLFNHTVAVNDSPTTRTGIRWYELRDAGTGAWSIYQQGTYAPADGNFRWTGSMAMNDAGDIGMAYSVSSSAMHPAMRFTGQTAAQSGTGVMDVAETVLFAGTGSQTGSANRWGDYSHVSLDPTDGATFWYTNLYYQTTSSFNWRTRIAHFSIAAVDPPILAVAPSSVSVSLDTDETATRTVTISNAAAPGALALSWSAAVQNATPSLTSGGTTVSDAAAPGGPVATSQTRASQASGTAETEGAPVRVPAAPRPTEPSASGKAAVACTDGQVLEQTTNSANFTINTTNEYGQSFAAPCDGTITSVVPNFLGTGVGAFETVMRLYDGLGVSGTVLAVVPNTTTTPASGFYEIVYTFPSPVEVVEGQTYTWFLDIVSGTTAMSVQQTDVYAGGSRWRSTTGNVANAFATSGDTRFRATFSAPDTWVSVSPTSGTAAPGAGDDIDVVFDATGLADGTYTADLVITSNDPASPTETVPLTLIVGGNEATAVLATKGLHAAAPAAAGMTVADLAAINLVLGVPGYAAGRTNLFTSFDGDGARISATGAGEVLELGRGFLWGLPDKDMDFGSGSVSVLLPTVLTTDTPNTADVTLDLQTAGLGVNIFGNPFGVPLDISAMAMWPNGGNLAANVFTWDVDGRRWVYDAGVTEIAPWQAFFVRTRPGRTGTVTIPASAAVGSAAWQASAKAPSATPVGVLRFDLDGTALDGEPLSDGAFALTVGDAATAEPKLAPLSSAYVTASFASADGLRAIEALRADGGSAELPVAIQTVGAERDLTLRWTAPSALPASWQVTLVDRRTNATLDLSRAGSYAFEQTSAPATDEVPDGVGVLAADGSSARFVLRIDTGDGAAKNAFDLALAAPYPNPTGELARVVFSLAEAGTVRLNVYDALGREVAVLADSDLAEGEHAVTFDASRLATGTYVIRLQAGGEVMTQRATVVR